MKKYHFKAVAWATAVALAILLTNHFYRGGAGAAGGELRWPVIPTAQISPSSVTFDDTRVGEVSAP